MKLRTKRSTGVAVAGIMLAGCAGTVESPTLEEARRAYVSARSGPAARYAPAELERAAIAVAQAERLAGEDPGSPEAEAQAYIALRRAELADAHAGAEVATLRRDRAVVAALDVQTRRLDQVSTELQQANTELFAALASHPQPAAAPEVRHEERGDVITVSDAVLFATGSAAIQPAAREKLDRVVAVLLAARERHVVVEGFTDATGSPGLNDRLSLARANAVREYFAAHGVDASRVSAEGHGERQPVATDATPEGRAANRRVEIVIQPTGAAEQMPPSKGEDRE